MKSIDRSSGGIVLNTRGEIVLVSQHLSGKAWSFPKGHVENNENDLDAAKREIHEETGLVNLDFIKDLGSYKRFVLSAKGKDDINKPKIIHLFLFKTTELKLKANDKRIFDVKWFKKDEVTKKLSSLGDSKYFKQILNSIY